MTDPKKVKPAKASGGAPTEDELDQFEVLNGMGVKIDPGAVQRLIEAARANAAPPPTPPPAPAADPYATPTRRVIRRQRVAEPEIDYRPLPPIQPRRRKPKSKRQSAPVIVEPKYNWTAIAWALVFAFAVYTFAKQNMVPEMIIFGLVFGAPAVWVISSRRKAMRKLRALEVAEERNCSSGARSYDEDDDDDDASFRYRQERWQGDNGLNGRVGWEDNSRTG